MSDGDWADWHMWSLRRSKANYFRLMSVFSVLFTLVKWFGDVCTWKNPATTVLIHVLLVMLMYFHKLMLPALLLFMSLLGIWNYKHRPCYPPYMDTRISCSEAVHLDELDEEFDTFPTSRSMDVVRMRYDRMHSVAGRIRTVVIIVVVGFYKMRHPWFQQRKLPSVLASFFWCLPSRTDSML
ncbi:hypothetical protein AAC387_Pa11g0316 [Persea americana]